MFINVRLQKQYNYQPHYGFFNSIRKGVSERVAEHYLEEHLIPMLEKRSTNLFIRMHPNFFVTVCTSMNTDWNHILRDELHLRNLFREESSYSSILPTHVEHRKKLIRIISENNPSYFYIMTTSDQIKLYLTQKEIKDQEIVTLYGRPPYNIYSNRDELLESLKNFTWMLPENHLRRLFKRAGTFFTSYRYFPDYMYLECEKEGIKILKVEEFEGEVWESRKIGELYFEVPVVKPKRIYMFEVKTKDPLNPSNYTSNQKEAINNIQSWGDSISLYIIYIPLENFVPLKGTFKVLVYEVTSD